MGWAWTWHMSPLLAFRWLEPGHMAPPTAREAGNLLQRCVQEEERNTGIRYQ